MSAAPETAPKRKRQYSEETLGKRAAQVAARHQARIEELEHLLLFDNNVEAVVRRIGFTSGETAIRWCMRVGRHDLAQRMHPYVGPRDVYNRFYGTSMNFGANAQAAS